MTTFALAHGQPLMANAPPRTGRAWHVRDGNVCQSGGVKTDIDKSVARVVSALVPQLRVGNRSRDGYWYQLSAKGLSKERRLSKGELRR